MVVQQLETYARIVWDPEDLIEIRPIPPKERGFWIPAKEITHQNTIKRLQGYEKNQFNVYAGVLPRSYVGGSKQEHATPGRVVWADIDHCEPQEGIAKATKHGLPCPTLVISSGHGTHLFWRLANKEAPQTLVSTVAGIARLIGADPSVADAARILRLPGFYNWKNPENPIKAAIHSGNPIQYNLSDLTFAIPVPVVTEMPSIPESAHNAWTYLQKVDGSMEGGRHNAAVRASRILRDFGLSVQAAEPLILQWNASKNTPPLPEKELLNTLESSYDGCLKPAGCKVKKPEKPSVTRIVQTELDVIASLESTIEQQSTGKGCGLPLPWPALQDKTNFLKPGTLSIIGGPTKTGKSFFLMALAINLHENGHTWCYLPLEDSRKEFAARALAVIENDYKLISDTQDTADYRAEKLALNREWLLNVLSNVTENPRIGCKNDAGDTVIPELTWPRIVKWTKEKAKTRQVIFIDPLAQIEFSARDQNKEEADFIRQLLAIAQDSQACIVLAAHTVKRRGRDMDLPLSEGDLQGSAMLSRLAHTLILLEAHDEKSTNIFGSEESHLHNRTVYIASARNGAGTRSKLAFNQKTNGPQFYEFGIMKPKLKGEK